MPSPNEAAAKTARLVDNFKQHAAEWAAADGSYARRQSPQPFMMTAMEVEGGTEAAFQKWRAATDPKCCNGGNKTSSSSSSGSRS